MIQGSKADWTAALSMIYAVSMDSEVTVVTDGNKATMITIDPSKVLFAKCVLDCPGEATKFTVRAQTMLKAIQASGGTEQEIIVDSDKGSIVVSGNCKVRVPMYTEEAVIKDISERFSDYVGMGRIEPAVLEPLMSFAQYQKQDKCKLMNNGDTITVFVGGEEGQMSEYSCSGGYGSGEVSCSLDYFCKVIKQAKGVNSVDIGFTSAEPSPFAVQWADGTVRITAILAPQIEVP